MADEQQGDFSRGSNPSESVQPAAPTPADGHGQLNLAARRSEESAGADKKKEELSVVNKKMEQAVKLFAEIGDYVEKAAPKHKRLLDEARVKVGDISLLLQQMADDEISGIQRIVAPMPGVIMRLDKRIGQNVRKGELLMILDAMKMENQIKAPVDGKVVSLPYAEGQKVSKGSVLAVISVRHDRNLSVAR